VTHREGTKAVATAASVTSSSVMRVTSEGVSVIIHDGGASVSSECRDRDMGKVREKMKKSPVKTA